MKLLRIALVNIFTVCLVWHEPTTATEQPQRIVSTHLCTDQYLLLLADYDRIVSISSFSTNPNLSVLAEEAMQFPLNLGQAEEIVQFQPDLILTIQFGNPHVALLRKLGYQVIEIPIAQSVEDIRSNILTISEVIGEKQRGVRMLKEFDRKLNLLRNRKSDIQPLIAIYRANGYTSGRQTLIAEIVQYAGLRNLATELGMEHTRHLPLEVLVTQKPHGLILDIDTKPRSLAYELPSHPAIRRAFAELPRINIPAKYWTCGTPFVSDALEQLVDFRQLIEKSSRQ